MNTSTLTRRLRQLWADTDALQDAHADEDFQDAISHALASFEAAMGSLGIEPTPPARSARPAPRSKAATA